MYPQQLCQLLIAMECTPNSWEDHRTRVSQLAVRLDPVAHAVEVVGGGAKVLYSLLRLAADVPETLTQLRAYCAH